VNNKQEWEVLQNIFFRGGGMITEGERSPLVKGHE